MPRQEATLSIPFPLGGVDVEKAFVRQPAGAPGPYGQMATTPVAHNVRALEVLTGRVRGASRPGLSRWLQSVVNFDQDGVLPSEITGLEAWYDANDIDTLWQDSARTTPVTADADPVGAWDDKSGNGRNLVQATAGKRPTYKVNIQNSREIIRFDGSDDVMSTATFTVAQPTTIFLVAKADAGGFLDIIADARVGAAAGARQTLYTDLASRWVFGAGTDYGTGIAVTTTFRVVLAVFNGVASRFEVNNVVGASDVNVGTQSRDGLAVGASIIESFFWDGDIAECGIYNRALDAADARALATGLLIKYGI